MRFRLPEVQSPNVHHHVTNPSPSENQTDAMRVRRPNWARTSKIAVGALVLATSGLFIASPSDATTASYTNPTACSAAVQDGVCISNVSVEGYGSFGVNPVASTASIVSGTIRQVTQAPSLKGSGRPTENRRVSRTNGATRTRCHGHCSTSTERTRSGRRLQGSQLAL